MTSSPRRAGHQRNHVPSSRTASGAGHLSPTNLLLTITNLWRYHAQGIDLGTECVRRVMTTVPGRRATRFYAPTNFFVPPAPKNTFLPLTNSSGARIVTFTSAQFLFSGDTNGLMLGLHAIIDDGAVFHLNGVEVFDEHAGDQHHLRTLSTVNVGSPSSLAADDPGREPRARLEHAGGRGAPDGPAAVT
jgi:hypothetical protein